MELDTLKYDDEIGKVVANDNGYKTTFTELYGIAGGTTFTVYLPGCTDSRYAGRDAALVRFPLLQCAYTGGT